MGGVDCVGCTHAAAGCNPPPSRSRRTLTNEMERGGTNRGRPGPSFTLIAVLGAQNFMSWKRLGLGIGRRGFPSLFFVLFLCLGASVSSTRLTSTSIPPHPRFRWWSGNTLRTILAPPFQLYRCDGLQGINAKVHHPPSFSAAVRIGMMCDDNFASLMCIKVISKHSKLARKNMYYHASLLSKNQKRLPSLLCASS